MPTGLIVLFWIWTGVSVVILLTRSVRRTKRVKATQMITNLKATAKDVIPASEVPKPAGEPSPAIAALPPVKAFSALPAGPPVAARSGVFAKEPEAAALPSGARITVADVLRGVQLPHNLAPLTGWNLNDVREGARAVFVTTNIPAETVGGALADELERIGMEVRSIADDTAIARRGDEAVQVQILVRGSGPAHPRYPSAPENSVIVQFDLA